MILSACSSSERRTISQVFILSCTNTAYVDEHIPETTYLTIMADLTVLAVIKLMIMVFIQYKIVQKLANLVITFFFAQPLPPGPRRLPIIGNVLQIPKSHVFLRWREWSNVYGPVIYLNVLGVRIVALHTVKAAQDLLARRGAKYSDRPRLFLAGELACKDMQLLLMPYDERFKREPCQI